MKHESITQSDESSPDFLGEGDLDATVFDLDDIPSSCEEHFSGNQYLQSFTGNDEQRLVSRMESTSEPELSVTSIELPAVSECPEMFKGFIDSEQLADTDYEIKYLIDAVVPLGEPGCIAARSKTLKTTIAIDMAVSVASGKKFLDYFDVLEEGNVAVVSGESGLATLKETAGRICNVKGLKLRDLGRRITWSTEVPRLPADTNKIRELIERQKVKLLLIDPAYYTLRDIGADLNNVTRVGAALEPLTDLSRATGCTIMLVAHNRKGRTADRQRFDPPGLEEIAGAGMDQWVRSWVLLGQRREFNAETGDHQLWMEVGGSAGNHGSYAVDVHEGLRKNPGGRIWEVSVALASKARKSREVEKAKNKADKKQRTRDSHVQKLREAIRPFASGETKKQLREITGLSEPAFVEAIQTLIARDEVKPCKVQKGRQTYDGFTFTEHLLGQPVRKTLVGKSVDRREVGGGGNRCL